MLLAVVGDSNEETFFAREKENLHVIRRYHVEDTILGNCVDEDPSIERACLNAGL